MTASSEHQVLHVKMFDTRFVHSSAPKLCIHSPFSILLGSRTEDNLRALDPERPSSDVEATAKELGGCRPAFLLSVPGFPHKQSGGNSPQLLGLKECRPVRRFEQGALGSGNLWGLFEPSCKKAPRAAPLEEVHSPPSRDRPARRLRHPAPALTAGEECATEIQHLEGGQGRAAHPREGSVGDVLVVTAAQLGVGHVEQAQLGETGEGPGLQGPQRVPGQGQRAETRQRGPGARRQGGQQVVAEVEGVQPRGRSGPPAQRRDAVVAQCQHL